MAHYSKPPIKEAILAFEIAGQPAGALTDLDGIGEQAKPDYSVRNVIHRTLVQVRTNVEAKPEVDANDQAVKLQFATEDGGRMFRVDWSEFSFHQTMPYESWEPFRDEARRLWEIYHGIVKTYPTTLGVRVINRLPIPLGTDLRDYLQLNLDLGRNLPQTIVQQLVRVDVPYREGVMLIVHQAFVPQEISDGLANIILDLDLRYQLPKADTTDAVWDFVERVRDDKNMVFEACITDALRERIR